MSLSGIGYMGFTQKVINPTFELEDENITEDMPTDAELNLSQQIILKKLLEEFENEKLFLQCDLNIMDVVKRVGTNRSYISAIINQKYNQNFCSFVNGYRIEELEKVFLANPAISNELLAEKCGFGSFNSMKRAIAARTNMSLIAWKNAVLETSATAK
jgi:AraC-like DNA-binding protein